MGTPIQRLTIMDACWIGLIIRYSKLRHPDTAKFEYKEQWARDKAFREKNIMGTFWEMDLNPRGLPKGNLITLMAPNHLIWKTKWKNNKNNF